MGRFDYPSPYWDSIGDPALDLIDRMLTANVERRITIDECLDHPWMTEKYPNIADSTDGLTGAMGQLDFSKRKTERERTLLSSINDMKVAHTVGDRQDRYGRIKTFDKNVTDKKLHPLPSRTGIGRHEATPAANRAPAEFMNLGGRGDPTLFDDNLDSWHEREDISTRGRQR